MAEAIHSAISKYSSIIGNRARNSSERIEAATAISWLARQNSVSALTVSLIRAVVSLLVDDLRANHYLDSEYADWAYWKHFGVVSTGDPDHPKELHRDDLVLIARLLFEGERHEDALPYFDALMTKTPSPEDVILYAYSLETISRKTRNVALAEKALYLLNNQFSVLLSTPPYVAEVNHLSGHLYILKGRFSGRQALGLQQLGVNHLAKAVADDPSYTSCYTFSFAEYGDYLSAIRTCLHAMNVRHYASLPARQAQLIDLELLFYLGYSMMSIGEFERAKRCFERFASSVEGLRLPEARDHARLFLCKLSLRRRRPTDLLLGELRQIYDTLRSLSFEHSGSIQMNEECRRYEAMTEFLMALSRSRNSGSVDAEVLENLALQGIALLERFVELDSGLMTGVKIFVGPFDKAARLTQAIVNGLTGRLRRLQGVSIERVSRSVVFSREDVISEGAIMLWCESPHSEIRESDSRIIFVDNRADKDELCVGADQAVSLALIGVCVIGIRRFLEDDQYVFGIVPCLESPASVFQRPSIGLDLVRL